MSRERPATKSNNPADADADANDDDDFSQSGDDEFTGGSEECGPNSIQPAMAAD